jgi:hypothetical protein
MGSSVANTPTEKQIKARPAIQLWLFMICALIFAMVIVGGGGDNLGFAGGLYY